MEIIKLSDQVINQIAAGEVVERPASVLKELMENSIDSGADNIEVYIEEGGIKKIEIRDNGKGIAAEDLKAVFSRHATSKISTIEDLDQIASYGFRGEALASISAVSKTKVVSRRGDDANTIVSTNGEVSEVDPASRGVGTTVIVSNLFDLLPGRIKFLKKPATEYRYVLEIFQYFALLNGKIHFKLVNNNKDVYSFPKTESNYFPIDRISKIYRIEKEDLLRVEHSEYGIKTVGVVLHPRILGSRSKMLVQYVNERPVQDRGIVHSIHQAYRGYIPENYKGAGIVGVFIDSTQVDINVHPRKMEVKFLNPFRVYSAVTHAIKMSLSSEITKEQVSGVVGYEPVKSGFGPQVTNKPSGNSSFALNFGKRESNAVDRLRGGQQNFFSDSSYIPNESIQETVEITENFGITPFALEKALGYIDEAKIVHALNRYIILILADEVWIVDQHAAAERVRFEQFRRAYLEGMKVEQQRLLTPISVQLSEQERVILESHPNIFGRLGFFVTLLDNVLQINAIPVALQKADVELLVRDTITQLLEHTDVFIKPVISDFATEKDMSLIVATMACHNSVRMNERVADLEARGIMKDLLKCDIPYACPHGRRVIWPLSKEEIDRNFMRMS